jgi:hypothetical protein
MKPTVSHSPNVTIYAPPSLLTTNSSQPSEQFTKENATESSMIIDQDKSMSGSATALVAVSVFCSVLMATGSAYLYRSVARYRGRKRNRLAALSEMLSSPSNEAALEIYLDLRNGNAESSETMEYLYSGGESGSKESNGEWSSLEKGSNGIIELPCPVQSAQDTKRDRKLVVTFSDETEVISIPTMNSSEMGQEEVIWANKDSKYDSFANKKPKGRKDKCREPLHLPPMIPTVAAPESLTSLISHHKIAQFDDQISVLSEFASDQLTTLMEDVNYIKSKLSLLNNIEGVEKTVKDDTCSAGECLQWFAGVSDNASNGSVERERTSKEEQLANIATIINFVNQRGDKKTAKKAEALMKRNNDENKTKRRSSSFKKGKKVRSRSLENQKGRHT